MFVGHSQLTTGWGSACESTGTNSAARGRSIRPTTYLAFAGLIVLLWTGSVRAQAIPPLADPLTLTRALELAREIHPDIRGMEQRAIAADQVPALVSRPADPAIFLSADHVPFSMPGVDVSGGIEFAAPLGRVLHHRRRVAEAIASGRHDEVEQMALEVELDVTMAFYALRYARSLGALLGAQRVLVEQLLAAATARYSSGLGSQAEVLRVQAERARIGALERTVEGLVMSAEGSLNAAIGRPAGSPIPTLEDPTTAIPASLLEALDEASRERPELAARAAFVEGASAQIGVMRGMYRPMIMTRLGAAYTMAEGPGLMGMLGFSVPIFRERLRAGVSEARAMRAMADAELDAQRFRIEGEVARAYGDFTAANGRARALHDEVVPLARQTVDAMLAEYAAGRVPLVSPIESARNLFSSEVEALATDLQVGMAEAAVSRAIGRSHAGER